MVKKGIKLSEEHKKKIGLANAPRMKEYWKNGRATDKQLEIKKKNRIRKEKLGYVNSPETREKLSKIMKEKFEKGKFNPKDISPYTKGHPAWNKGLKMTEEQKIKIGNANRGHIMSDEQIEKYKEWRKKQITPVKDTSIEIKIQHFLEQLSIEYYVHQYMGQIEHSYQCDILIPSLNLVIECDGDYWHNYPFGNEIDIVRTKELNEVGFNVLRLWERDIKLMDLITFKDKILGIIK